MQGRLTVNSPEASKVTEIGVERIVASFASSMRCDGVKTTVPEAADPVLFKYCPKTVLTLTSLG